MSLPADAASAASNAAVELDEKFVAKYTVKTSFRGKEVALLQTPRDKGEDGQDNTGWAVWEASNILLRWVASDANVAHALSSAPGDANAIDPAPAHHTWSSLSVLDLSAGAGLVALAAAAGGARAVAASDIPAQLPQLRDNIRRSGYAVVSPTSTSTSIQGGIAVIPYYWGEDVAALKPSALSSEDEAGDVWYDLVLVSDIIFIAIRDGRTKELEKTLRDIVPHCR